MTMKRITSLLASLALCCGLAAQTYNMRIVRTDSTETTDQQRINFLDDGRVAIVTNEWDNELWQYRVDTVDASSLKTVDFLTQGGRLWEMDYARQVLNSDRHNDYGYGSIMHIRDLLTEDMTVISSGYNWYSSILEAVNAPAYANTYIPWYYYLESIAVCNDVIKALPADAASSEEKAVLAEVLTIRAMLYLDFARMYEFLPNERATGVTDKGVDVNGLTVPLLDEDSQDLGSACFVPRASKDEVVAFIRRDLDRAEELMPFITESSHEVPHLDALYGLRARLALWNGDYREAATYAARAINISTTRPMTTEQMLSTTKGFNDINCWMWGVQQTGDNNLSNFASWLSAEYDGGYASLVPPMVGRSFYERIKYADPRKLWFVAPSGSPLYQQTPLISPYASFEPYTAVKFRPANGMTSWQDGGHLTGYPLMRVEEMYFIRAEATAYSDAAAAREQLTDFMRTYRYDSYNCKATDLDGILKEIILQKRIELWGEGQTFFDVKRLNLDVTRNYAGTNFYDEAALNTVGRPYWMNMQFPSNAPELNPALYGKENPWENCKGTPQLNENLRLAAPAYMETHDILPLDSIYRFILKAYSPEDLTGSVTIELSLSPEFELGKTVAYTTLYLEGQEQETGVTASDFCQKMKRLLGSNSLLQSGQVTAYLRLLTDEAYSPALALPLLLPENYEGHYNDFSFAPRVTATTVGEIDCELMAGEDRVKVVNLNINGEGDFYSSDNGNYEGAFLGIGTLYFADYRDNFYINAEGQCNNAYSNFNEYALFPYNYVINQSAQGYTFGDGCVVGSTVRDGLIFRFSTDSVAVNLRFNQQMIAEQTHSWRQVAKEQMTSTFDTELTGTQVTIERTADDSTLFRLVTPYQRGHNLMFYRDAEGTLTMPRQMASYSNTQGVVYVEGTGAYAEGVWTFQLRFTGRETPCTEQLGFVEEWTSLGTGTYRDDLVASIYGVENLAYSVEIEQSNKGKIRLLNPYENYPYNDPGDFDTSNAYNLTFDVSDPYHVVMVPEEADLGFDWGYGMFRILHRSNYYGTFANGVITFPPYAFYTAMSNYSGGSWSFYGNSSGLFAIALPGYEIPEKTDDPDEPVDYDDYSVYISSKIIENSDGGSISYTIQLGNDVQWARYAFATSENYLTVCSALEEGAGTVIPIQGATVTQEVTENGQYYIVVIADDGKGRWNFELKTTEYVKQSWSPIATGTYYYSLFSDNDEGELSAEPGHTLYQSANDTVTFKIDNWLNGTSFLFTWDKTTNACVVKDQPTDFEYSSYGMMYIIEGKDYSSRYAEKTSYYDPETKTFHFFLVYYVEAGTFGQYEELFEITEGGQVKHHVTRRISPQALGTRTLSKKPATHKLSDNARRNLIRETDAPKPQIEKKEALLVR